jgi:dTDP-4-dehydrorhamnose 3,5-epimerase
MNAAPLGIPEVVLTEPCVLGEARGFSFESFNQAHFDGAVGGHWNFGQDNHSRSMKGVMYGLQYQIQQARDKLVWLVAGEVLDVAVDNRRTSVTFGRWISARLSAEK